MIFSFALTFIVCSIVLPIFLLEPEFSVALLYAIAIVPIGTSLIIVSIKETSIVATPFTIFAAIWLVLIPLTATAAPLMDEMTASQVAICLIACIAFCFGSLLVWIVPAHPRSHGQEGRTSPGPNQTLRRAADVILAISIAALIANMLLEERVALFDVGADERKASAQFFGYPVLASVGTISLAIYARLGAVSRWRALIVVCYIALQLLTGQRWVAILGIVLCITLASSDFTTRRRRRLVAGLMVVVVIAFVVISLFRGGASDQQRYFITTGLYAGDPILLQATELSRYVGMSQRNMETVLARDPSTFQPFLFSGSPFTSLFVDPPEGLGTSIHGYTATNAISYLYADFGFAWPLVVAAFGVGINFVYRRRRRQRTMAADYLWAVAAFGLAVSFFAYVHAYVYWVILFPLIVAALEAWAGATSRSRFGRSLPREWRPAARIGRE